jgi:hypothetical protein
MAKFKRTTAEVTRVRVDADCYGHAGHGYLKKGEYIEVPKGTPISQTWTEVDEDGNEVEDGFKSKKVSRHVSRPAGEQDKSYADIGEEEAEDVDEEPSDAAPTPPSAPAAKPAKVAKKAPAAKPAKG